MIFPAWILIIGFASHGYGRSVSSPIKTTVAPNKLHNDVEIKREKDLIELSLELAKERPDLIIKDLDMIIFPRKKRNNNNLHSRGKRAAIEDDLYLWPNATVPYKYDEVFPVSESMRNFSQDAMKHISDLSCIVFKERTTEQHYLNITARSTGCFAYTGFIENGGQELNLRHDDCTGLEVSVHEMMHALGFLHEHNRPDRDDHVYVNFTNLIPGGDQSYAKFNISDGGYGGITLQDIPYDKQSVMHYHRYAFTKHSPVEGVRDHMAIYSLDDHMEILGNQNGFSDSDIRRLNKRYSCNNDVEAIIANHNGASSSSTTMEPPTSSVNLSNPSSVPVFSPTLSMPSATLQPSTTSVMSTSTATQSVEPTQPMSSMPEAKHSTSMNEVQAATTTSTVSATTSTTGNEKIKPTASLPTWLLSSLGLNSTFYNTTYWGEPDSASSNQLSFITVIVVSIFAILVSFIV